MFISLYPNTYMYTLGCDEFIIYTYKIDSKGTGHRNAQMKKRHFYFYIMWFFEIISIVLSDITSSDRESEHFLKKLNRARFAIARTSSIRSLSVCAKPPYRRAVSVPMHLLTKTPPPKGIAWKSAFLVFVFAFKAKAKVFCIWRTVSGIYMYSMVNTKT